jgi:hypothetical protein
VYADTTERGADRAARWGPVVGVLMYTAPLGGVVALLVHLDRR